RKEARGEDIAPRRAASGPAARRQGGRHRRALRASCGSGSALPRTAAVALGSLASPKLPGLDEVLRREHEPLDPLAASERESYLFEVRLPHATVVVVVRLDGDAWAGPASVEAARRARAHLGLRKPALLEE